MPKIGYEMQKILEYSQKEGKRGRNSVPKGIVYGLFTQSRRKKGMIFS